MARFLNHLVGRSRTRNPKNAKCSQRKRRLRSEALESRQMLAANIFHNEAFPEDVNEDGIVSASDALMIINEINRQGQRDLSAADFEERRGPGRMTDVNNDGRDSPLDALRVMNRIARGQGDRGGDQDPGDSVEVRSIDGSGNNLENPELGSTDTELLRVAENDYADGISEPSGENRPSAREISNTLFAVGEEETFSERGLSSFVFAWGQFLDHDIDLSLESESEDSSFDIEVPTGDPLFDPFGTGEATIHLTRSAFADGTGTSIDNPAEQVNAITTWVDGSQVYGSDEETADALREFVGGRLLITDDGLLPTDENGGLLAGDIRAAENVVLTSMHALFVREHNRIADELAASDADLTDEELYQQARTQVIAQLQSITYNEFLPALLGEEALSRYEGYDSSVDASIANEFSTAAFRFGHSTLNDEFRLVGNDGVDLQEPISLANAFFQPELLEDTGIDPFLKYASSTLSQEVDLEVVDSLRNFLFGPPGAGGLDLVSLNIQRGRDHGLADYNATREAYGLSAAESFSDITSDVDVQAKLETLYGDVDNIDLWVGILAEDHTSDGSLGETASTIIADQFERLRDGDRFYYENVMTRDQIREVEQSTLSEIISRNTNVDGLQEDVFFFRPTISGTVTAENAGSGQGRTAELDPLVDGTFPLADEELELLALDQGRGGNNNSGVDRDQRDGGRGQRDIGVEGVALELIDSEGNVVAETETDRSGRFTFDQVSQSGEYAVRIVATTGMDVLGSETWDVLVNNSDLDSESVDFRVVVS
ncbi:MAG: peroxidase family protein [Planctomycetota bacterium]